VYHIRWYETETTATSRRCILPSQHTTTKIPLNSCSTSVVSVGHTRYWENAVTCWKQAACTNDRTQIVQIALYQRIRSNNHFICLLSAARLSQFTVSIFTLRQQHTPHAADCSRRTDRPTLASYVPTCHEPVQINTIQSTAAHSFHRGIRDLMASKISVLTYSIRPGKYIHHTDSREKHCTRVLSQVTSPGHRLHSFNVKCAEWNIRNQAVNTSWRILAQESVSCLFTADPSTLNDVINQPTRSQWDCCQ
jgi:hypothetical protein